jgi:uncharacterized protein YcbX
MSEAIIGEATITGLVIYPVKSMGGIALSSARLTALGLEHDRRWMIIDDQCQFITQSKLAKLALIVPTIEEAGLVLSAPGGARITIPYDVPAGERLTTEVWGRTCNVIDEGAAISHWLNEALQYKRPLRLVRMAPGAQRNQTEPDVMGADTRVEFADAAPFLIANEASLAAVNAALTHNGEQAVPMNRFRPNIVVKGLPAFAEHNLKEIAGNGFRLQFRVVCERCVVTTINQETAERHPGEEPFRTIRTLNPSPEDHKSPVFGHYATLTQGNGAEIATGVRVSLLD